MDQKHREDTDTEREPVVLEGTIERFTYRNTETGFAVVRLQPESGQGPVTAVGQLSQLAEGQRVKITGVETEHPRYGRQIQVRSAEAVLPTTVEGIRTYLASSLVKGIGPATARRITDTFGPDTLRIIEEEPKRLSEVKGLGAKRIVGLAFRLTPSPRYITLFFPYNDYGRAPDALSLRHGTNW